LLTLLTIDIGIDPEIHDFGGLLLTWHGVFTAVGIAGGVFVAVVVGRRMGFIDDDIYTAALIAVPFGIIGARALFVFEHWDTFMDDPVEIVRINEGGISIWGAVIGGFIGGMLYGWIRGLNMLRALDVAAVSLILGMGIGRIGDIINGEHFAEPSSLPWAVRYTHINSPSVIAHPDCGLAPGRPVESLCAQHPAVGYEMVGDILIFAVFTFLLLRLFSKNGLAFFGVLFAYSAMRFGVSYLRLDSGDVFLGITWPQTISLVVMPLSAIGFVWVWFRGREREPPLGVRQPAVAPPPVGGRLAGRAQR
jgi:phosphatidylglycerol:prolipoprotein diacylglycerol transferase